MGVSEYLIANTRYHACSCTPCLCHLKNDDSGWSQPRITQLLGDKRGAINHAGQLASVPIRFPDRCQQRRTVSAPCAARIVPIARRYGRHLTRGLGFLTANNVLEKKVRSFTQPPQCPKQLLADLDVRHNYWSTWMLGSTAPLSCPQF